MLSMCKVSVRFCGRAKGDKIVFTQQQFPENLPWARKVPDGAGPCVSTLGGHHRTTRRHPGPDLALL